MRFEAMLREGTVYNKKTMEDERKTFIMAIDLPAAALDKDWKGPHPHQVPGLAWSITDNAWRNMKNAVTIGCVMVDVECDPNHPEWFRVV